MKVAVLTFFVAMITVSSAHSQQNNQAFEQLKKLNFLLGNAVAEYTVPPGWDAVAPAGTRVTRRSVTRWGLNRNMLITNFSQTYEGAAESKWMEIIGWDADKNQIVHWIISPGGGGSGTWTRDGKKWLLQWKSVTPDKATYTGTGQVWKTGPNTFMWGITDGTRDDKKIDDIPTVEFKKSRPAMTSEAEIQKGIERWVETFNKHDSATLAKEYAGVCDVQHGLNKYSSRDEVQSAFEDYFSRNPNVKTEITGVSRRMIGPNMYVEDGIWEEWGHSEPVVATKGLYTSIAKNVNGKWQFVHERAWPMPEQLPQTNDDQPTAEDYLKFVTPYFPGTWHLEAITGADEVVMRGKLEVSMAPNGKCGISHELSEDGDPVATAIHGYDPRARHWRVVENRVDGAVMKLAVYMDKKVLVGGAKTGASYRFERTLTSADGVSSESSWTAHIVDKNTLEMRFVSGEAVNDVKKIRYKRED